MTTMQYAEANDALAKIRLLDVPGLVSLCEKALATRSGITERRAALKLAWDTFGTREMFTEASAGWFFPEIREFFRSL